MKGHGFSHAVRACYKPALAAEGRPFHRPPPFRLQFPSPTDDNRIVPSTSFYQEPPAVSPFRPGVLVIATLTNPREKFWGAILYLSSEGILSLIHI